MPQNLHPKQGEHSFMDRYLPDGNSPDYRSAHGGAFSIQAIRAILWRQRVVLVAVVGLALLAGLVYSMLQTPLYQASATVRVTNQAGQIVEGQDVNSPYIAPNMISTYMETLTQVIESRAMALRVVDSLDLQDSEVLLGKMATDPAPAGTSAKAHAEQRRQAAAGMLQSAITTEVPVDSQIIAISYSSPDRQLAAKIANAYVDNFLKDDLNQSIEANAYARDFLEEQIVDVRARLQTAEMQAIRYARANGIIAQPLASGGGEDAEATSGTAPTLTASNLLDVNRTYTEARARRIKAEERWQAVAAIPAAQLPEVQQSSTVQTLRTQIAQRTSRLAELRQRYRDDYPEVRELTSEIEALNRQIGSIGTELKNSIRNEFLIAQRQESGLSDELGQVSSASLDEQDRRVQYNIIDREVSALRAQLAALMERYNQISAAANLRSSNVTLLDQAVTPGAPYSPNLLKNLMVALVLGLGIAGVIVVLRETLDDRLRSIDDIEQKLGLPALGQTPYVADHVAEEIEDKFSPIGEAYSSIRASIDYSLAAKRHKVLLFTSSQPSEGKTTSATAVARQFASLGRKVLLVDMDLRRPSVHQRFAVALPKTGVVDVLYGRLPLESALLAKAQQNLDVLPVGPIPPNPVEILSSGLVPEFLQRVSETYDLIIIDSSPVMGIADAPLLSRFADAVILMVEANRTHAREARAAVRRLLGVRANVTGVIVSKYRALETGQQFDYQYRYYTYDAKS